MRVTDVEPTPNPNARKFVLSESLGEDRLSFFSADQAKGNAVGERLFAVPGVTSVLILRDFVTVNKSPSAKWPEVVAGVKKAIAG